MNLIDFEYNYEEWGRRRTAEWVSTLILIIFFQFLEEEEEWV